MSELLRMSVGELARLIRDREVSAVEVVDTHIRRIEEVNPTVNAVVVPNFYQAMERAKKVKNLVTRKKEELPPLLGVPCTVKDTYAMKGLPHAAGVVGRKHLIAEEDATIVKRIKESGAIIMGKTNTPEGAIWMETYNKVYGRSNNPHNPKHTTGGSSGGEGAIIATGASPFGPGSDVGGSIRFPAFFNGVVGHKASGCLLPQTGHWPPSPGEVNKYMCCGPLARYVDDLSLLMKLWAGPDGRDKYVTDGKFDDPASVNIKDVKAYYFLDNGFSHSDPDVRLAVRKAADALQDAGIPVESWTPPGIKRGFEIWSAMMALGEGQSFEDSITEGKGIRPARDILKFFARKSDYTFPVLGMMLMERLSKNNKAGFKKLYEKGKKLRACIEEKLGPNGVLICPPYNQAAPRHTVPWLNFAAISYSATFNVLEFPATVVPIFWNAGGLPVGVQILGRRFADHVTLRVGKLLEEAYGGWKPAMM